MLSSWDSRDSGVYREQCYPEANPRAKTARWWEIWELKERLGYSNLYNFSFQLFSKNMLNLENDGIQQHKIKLGFNSVNQEKESEATVGTISPKMDLAYQQQNCRDAFLITSLIKMACPPCRSVTTLCVKSRLKYPNQICNIHAMISHREHIFFSFWYFMWTWTEALDHWPLCCCHMIGWLESSMNAKGESIKAMHVSILSLNMFSITICLIRLIKNLLQ